MRPMQVLLENQ